MYSFLGPMYITNGWKCSERCLMVQLSDTHWACRHIACRNVMDRLPAIVQVLEEVPFENHPQRAVEARGILAQIDLNFAGSLVLFRKVLSDSNFLSYMLQSKTVDYAKAVELVEALKGTLVKYRSQTSFDEMWTEILYFRENQTGQDRHQRFFRIVSSTPP